MTENKIIHVCIIDDEPIACRRIQRLLKEDTEVEIVAICNDGEEALEAIQQFHPDLIFLDVQMPGMDGFEVLSSLNPDSMPHVIFVTAFDRYAIKAFEVHALDYLLKPFDRKRFEQAVQRSKGQIYQTQERSNSSELVALLKEMKSQSQHLERLVVKSQGRVFFLKTDEIDWIEAQGKHVSIHIGKETHLVREAMNSLETELDPKKFARIHKSTIVNIDRIKQLQPLVHGDFKVILRDSTVLTISRRYRQKIDELLGKSL
jgi:two-component system LytT family response regulator